MKRVLAITLLIFAILPTTVAHGADTSVDTSKLTFPRLEIPIPLIHPFAVPTVQTDGAGKSFLEVDYLSNYIGSLYTFLVGIASVVAGLMIVWAGVQWLTSSGNPESISAAKHRIENALIGLVLILGSYTIIKILNPALVLLKPLRVEYASPILLAIPEENDSSFDATATAPEFCPGTESLVAVPRTALNLGLSADRDLLLPEAGAKLLEAAAKAAERGYGLYVCSAGRTIQKQQALWDNALRQYGNEETARRYVSRPGCGSPHITGRAVDVVLMSQDLSTPVTGDGCTKSNVSGGNAAQSTEEQRILEQIMVSAGWRRYCAEWWHFEYGTPRAQRAGSASCAN